MKLGETYLLPQGHLWVVASLPSATGDVALIYMTSWTYRSDPACIIQKGEHSHVTGKTGMAYGVALVANAAQQTAFKAAASGTQFAPVTPALLAKIQNGAISSDHTPQKVQTLIQSSLATQAAAALRAVQALPAAAKPGV